MLFLNNDFVYRKIYNVHLLIPICRNDITMDTISLNDTAALIINKCNKSESVDELASCVANEFIDVDKDEIISDIREYVMELISEGLIKEQ